MATIRAYTNLQQSKKLAEILPLESADMYYSPNAINTEGEVLSYNHFPKCIETIQFNDGKEIFAWSLAALISALLEIQGGKPVIALDDNYITYPHMSDLHTKADNLIDACVAMIEKLHELNLL